MNPTPEVINRLMDGDPAIRWQTRRNVFGAPAEDWQAERGDF